jgi:hypothetical protein
MKLLKLAIISALALFLLLTSIASLLPSQVRISRAVDISAMPPEIMAHLRPLNRWGTWNEYVKAQTVQQSFTDSIVSDKLTIQLQKEDPVSVNTKWTQKDGKSFRSVFHLSPSQSVTTVQWYFEFSFKWYPWEKFSSIVYDKQLGPHMEQSLLTLKQLVENTP